MGTTKLIVPFRNFAKVPKNQSVNTAYGTNCCPSEIHTKHTNIPRIQNVEILMLNLVVYIVTTGFKRIKQMTFSHQEQKAKLVSCKSEVTDSLWLHAMLHC